MKYSVAVITAVLTSAIICVSPVAAESGQKPLSSKVPEQVYIDCEQASYDLEVEVKNIGKFIAECLNKRGYGTKPDKQKATKVENSSAAGHISTDQPSTIN